MFTGIVEATGKVGSLEPTTKGCRLTVIPGKFGAKLAIGESIAVNGCCLTLAGHKPRGPLEFDLLSETIRLTGFSAVKPGAKVNLERSLGIGGMVGGHFVTGHIDTVGEVELMEKRGSDYFLRVGFPRSFDRLTVLKGSIAIDGVSLTIAEVSAGRLAVWLIPHTLEATNLGERRRGDPVNLEFDLLGKHVEKLIAKR